MTPVRLEPAALRSRVNHFTTEPLRSHKNTHGQIYASLVLIACVVKRFGLGLRIYINVPALNVQAYTISTEIECAGSFDKLYKNRNHQSPKGNDSYLLFVKQ